MRSFFVNIGAVTAPSQADELHAVWLQQAAATEKERKEKENELRSKTAKYSVVLGPYAYAAQAFVEGAIALSNIISKDQNSKEQQARALGLIAKFGANGWVPPAFNPDTQFAAGYANLLEGILNEIGHYPVLNRFGQLFKRYAFTDPIVQTIGNASAKSWGFFSGQVSGNQRLYPERALLAARLVALDKGVNESFLADKALSSWNFPINWGPVPRNEKGNPSDVALYTSSLAYVFNVADAWGSELSKGKTSTAVKAVAGAATLGLGWWLFRKGVFRGI